MVGFVYENELVPQRVKLNQSITRHDTLDRCDSDVGSTRSMVVPHLYVNVFIWVCKRAVARGLFHELATVGENEGLGGIVDWRNAVDQMREDDLAAIQYAFESRTTDPYYRLPTARG